MQTKKIAGNFFSILSGQISSFVLNFLSITIAARYLGVENFGFFGYLLSVATIFSKVIDFGFAPIIFRELSKTKDRMGLLNTGIMIRIVAFFILLIGFNLSFLVRNVSWMEVALSNLLLFNIIFSAKFYNIRELMDIPFKTTLMMFGPSLVMFLENLLFFCLVLVMPIIHGGVFYFYFSYFIANVPGFLVVWYLLWKHFNYKPHWVFTDMKWLMETSFSVYLYIILAVILQQIDVVLLKAQSTKYALGIYSAAVRLAVPILIIPGAIIHTIFPLLNELHKEDITANQGGQDKNKIMVESTFKILFLLPVVLSIAFSVKPDAFVSLVFGSKYVDAASATVILLWGQIFVFHSFFVTNLLVIYNGQKWGIAYGLITVLVDVVLCIYFIPRGAYLGAALAKSIAVFAGWLLTTVVIQKYAKSFYLPNLRTVLWTVAVFAIAKLLAFLPLLFFMAFMFIVCICLTIFVRLFNNTEIIFILNMLHLSKYTDRAISFQERFSL